MGGVCRVFRGGLPPAPFPSPPRFEAFADGSVAAARRLSPLLATAQPPASLLLSCTFWEEEEGASPTPNLVLWGHFFGQKNSHHLPLSNTNAVCPICDPPHAGRHSKQLQLIWFRVEVWRLAGVLCAPPTDRPAPLRTRTLCFGLQNRHVASLVCGVLGQHTYAHTQTPRRLPALHAPSLRFPR
jgi:hypothetical protein